MNDPAHEHKRGFDNCKLCTGAGCIPSYDGDGNESGTEPCQFCEVRNELTEVLDALERLVYPKMHTFVATNNRKSVSSGTSDGLADALRILAKHNRFEITEDRGRVVIGKWKEKT